MKTQRTKAKVGANADDAHSTDITSIKLSLHTKQKLDAAKVHPRETYDQLLSRIFDSIPLTSAVKR